MTCISFQSYKENNDNDNDNHNLNDMFLISELQGGRPPSLAPEALFQGIPSRWSLEILLKKETAKLEEGNAREMAF